jgi:hypothetical protein
MAIGANVSIETAAQLGYDPDYLLAELIALIFTPIIADQLEIRFLGYS